jgi:D-alanyl-lipoteichoic acid acyltransferase DltB (MBOAT superfamily)
MNVCSIEWVSLLFLVSGVFFLLRPVWLRQTMLALCSLGFLATQVPDARGWLALAVFLAAGYVAARFFQRHPSRAGFLAYLLVFIIKQYDFVKSLLPASFFQRGVALVGLSYMLFRQIHLVVDALEGQIEHLSLWNYLNYQLNLFGLIAGPIQRYQDFCQSWMRLDAVWTDAYGVLKACLRIFIGVIKVTALAPPCLAAYKSLSENYVASTSGWKAAAQFLLLLYLFPAYMYFNFSGYCDMVIAGASLVGMKMPENFNYPFLSRNLGDFWTRWHRTLGFWIRDYLFTPLFKNSAQRWPRHAVGLSYASFFIAFVLAGMWHGSTWNFAIFGFLNGVGVAAAKVWETFLVRRFGRQGLKAYLQSPRIRAAAIVASFHYVCFTMLFFPSDLQQTTAILRHVIRLR